MVDNLNRYLINVISDAKSTLNIDIYSITKPSVVNSITTAKKRNLTVRIITDAKGSQCKFESEELA